MESVMFIINEHLSSVGEEILEQIMSLLEKQSSLNVVRVFVLQRLAAAAERICTLFQREMEELHTHLQKQHVKLLHTADVPLLPVSKEEVCPEQQERGPRPVQEEPEPPQIKEEQEELLQRPQEAERSSLILLERRARGDTLSDVPLLPVSKEEVCPEQQDRSPRLVVQEKLGPPQIKEEQERGPRPVQEKPEPPQIKEEQEELLQRPPEAEGSSFILLDRRARGDTLSEEVSPPEQQGERRRSPSLVHEEPEPPQIKEEQSEELLLRPEEAYGAAAAALTSPTVKSEGEDDENGETEPPAGGASAEHMKTQAYVNYWGASRPTVDVQPLSSHRSEDTDTTVTEDSDEWEDTGVLSAPEPHETQRVEGQTSNKDLKSSKQGRKTPFRCAVCGKTVVRNYLKRHMMTHTGEKPYVCQVCGKRFAQMTDAKRHETTHTGEKSFECTVCGKHFNRNAHLRRHMATHTGEKPFGCTVCGKCFGQEEALKRHVRNQSHTGQQRRQRRVVRFSAPLVPRPIMPKPQ